MTDLSTNQPDEADFVCEFDSAYDASVDVQLSDWIARWPDDSTREAVTCSLLRCACEHRSYDLSWFARQLAGLPVALPVETRQLLLREIFLDQAPSAAKPSWDQYQPLGFSATELSLQCPEDRCYLGQTIDDNRYVLQTRLASGGLGTVYQGVDLNTQAEVAIKTPLRLPARGDDFLAQRIRDEAQILREISLPGIPRFIDLLEITEGPALVTELIHGVTLQSLVPSDGLPEDEALRLTSKVARIADRLHQAEVVHGDIKANNVLVNDDDQVTLVDFNVSRQADPAQLKEGFPGGTLPAMSPEAIVGVAADVDLRQDVYALGTLLYYCISRKELFVSANREEAIVKSILLSGVHEPDFPEGTSESVRQICLAAISRHPTSRFETAGDFAATCQQILAGSAESLEIPPRRPWLTAWRLGGMLGMLIVRQRRVSMAFADLDSLISEDSDRSILGEAFGYAMGVTTALEEVAILAAQLQLVVQPMPGTEDYATAFYRLPKLQRKDLQRLAGVVEDGDSWCRETLGSLQSALIEKRPAAAALLMAAVQAQMAPYSEEAATRWLQCAKLLPAPESVFGEFHSRCQDYAGHAGLLAELPQLDYRMVKWLRWESREACRQEETGGT